MTASKHGIDAMSPSALRAEGDLLRSATHGPKYRRIQLSLVLLSAFAATTGGTFIDVVLGGRLPSRAGSTGGVVGTQLGQAFDHGAKLWLLFCTVAILLVNSRIKHTNTGALFSLITVVLALQLVNRIDLHTWHLSGHYWMLLAIGAALWSIGIEWSDLQVIGYIAGALAVGTLLMTQVTSHAWMYSPAHLISDTKAIFGDRILAGPFGQMNNLGMSAATGFPFQLLIKRRGIRNVLIGASAIVCILSASRTSLLAVLATSVALILLRVFRDPDRRRRAAVLGLLSLLAAIVVLPIHTSDPRAYTRRGEIWINSIHLWPSTWETGSSTYTYSSEGMAAEAIGRHTHHGHNLFITVATMGGLLLILALLPLIVSLVKRVFATLPYSITPLLFMVIIMSMSITEMPLRIDDFKGASWITWTSLLAILLFSRDEKDRQRSASAAVTPSTA